MINNNQCNRESAEFIYFYVNFHLLGKHYYNQPCDALAQCC